MKVYYQSVDNKRCYVKTLTDISGILESEVNELYLEKEDSELDDIYKTLFKKIETLKSGEEVKFSERDCSFGAVEMTEEEYNTLPEFQGW